MAKKLLYSDAVAELEKILAELDGNTEINMELISEKVKRAAVLLEVCKKQLHEIDTDLEKILETKRFLQFRNQNHKNKCNLIGF